MGNVLLISDAAKAVQVESHVLRYWEEELQLPIQRNEQGHRYYTYEDVERFKKIKNMKENGLQLKAIKMILKNGRVGQQAKEQEKEKLQEKTQEKPQEKPINGVGQQAENSTWGAGMQMGAGKQEITGFYNQMEGGAIEEPTESREQKAKRLQWIMQQLIRQAVQENNAELLRQMKENMVKELDYQFRMQEEREEERDRKAIEREEQHYRQIDELIRQKAGKKTRSEKKKEQRQARESQRAQARAAEQLAAQDAQAMQNTSAVQNIQDTRNTLSAKNMKSMQVRTAGQAKGQDTQDKILQMQGRISDGTAGQRASEKNGNELTDNKSSKKKFLFLSL